MEFLTCSQDHLEGTCIDIQLVLLKYHHKQRICYRLIYLTWRLDRLTFLFHGCMYYSHLGPYSSITFNQNVNQVMCGGCFHCSRLCKAVILWHNFSGLLWNGEFGTEIAEQSSSCDMQFKISQSQPLKTGVCFVSILCKWTTSSKGHGSGLWLADFDPSFFIAYAEWRIRWM